MKYFLALLLLTFAAGSYSSAQSPNDCTIHETISGRGKNFKVVGTQSLVLIDSLFVAFPKTKRRGYIWKFKKIQVPGIAEPITLKVHQGIYGTFRLKTDTSTCQSGSYFHSFTSEKYKKSLLSNLKNNEYPAINIYVMRGREYVRINEEETERLKNYLIAFL